MHPPARVLLLLGPAMLLAISAGRAHAGDAAPDLLTLRNGARVLLIPFEDSTDIEIITIVPLGLCGDEPGRAQWSHLLEHLVVTQDGIQPFDEVNAETMSDCMHLDYTRPADTWREGIELHARWLTNNAFAADAVQREIGRVVEEVNGLAASGRTTKFAAAAWAQAVRYGRQHIEMNGDVNRATADELTAYFQRQFLNGPRPMMVVAGRFDREKVEQAVRELIEPIELPGAPDQPPRWVGPEEIPAQVIWDLSTSHLVFAWRIPDDITLTELAHLHAAMPALSQLVMVPAAAYIRPGTYVLPESDVRVGDRRYVLLHMTMQQADAAVVARAKDDVGKAQAALTAARGPSRAMGRIATVQQWQPALDPAAALKALAGQNLPRRMVEVNLALAASLREFEFGQTLPAMITALEQGSDDAARAALARVFSDDNGFSLLIIPRDQHAIPLFE